MVTGRRSLHINGSRAQMPVEQSFSAPARMVMLHIDLHGGL